MKMEDQDSLNLSVCSLAQPQLLQHVMLLTHQSHGSIPLLGLSSTEKDWEDVHDLLQFGVTSSDQNWPKLAGIQGMVWD